MAYRSDLNGWRTSQSQATHAAVVSLSAFLQRSEDSLMLLGAMGCDTTQASDARLRSLITDNTALLELACLDATGATVIDVSKDGRDLVAAGSVAQTDWFQSAVRGMTFYSGVQHTDPNGPFIILAVPGQNGRVAAGRLRLDVLWIVINDLRLGSDGTGYVIDSKGTILAHTDRNVVAGKTIIGERPEVQSIMSAAHKAWTGSYVNFAGVHVVGSSTEVPDTDWAVVTELPAIAVYATSRDTMIFMVLAIVVVGFLSVRINQYLTSRLILQRLYQLRKGAERLGWGDLHHRIPITRMDELGVVAATFNDMAGRLHDREEQLASQNAALEREVAERAQAQEALSESEHRVKAILSAVQAGVVVIDAETHTIVDANAAAMRLIGGTADNIIGHMCHKAICPAAEGQCPVTDLKQTIDNAERVLLRPDGGRVPILNTASRISLGGRACLIESFVDISERKRAENVLREAHDQLELAVELRTAELHEANEDLQAEVAIRVQAEEGLRTYATKLERSNAELQEFAYVASHDLQEPLRKVRAFGDRLRDRYGEQLGDQGLDYLTRMQNAAARMQTLIEGLLTYSRVATKAQPFVATDLNEVARGVQSDLEMLIEQAGATLQIAALPTIEVDPLQARQLLQNLLGNALKFCRAGVPPVVRISAEHVNGQGERMPGDPSVDEYYRISVADNGIGFDEKYLDRIFQVFQRLHGRSEYEGSGIGLAVCRKIAERHGGSITARSAPGQGATFIVTLPAKQAHEGEVA